MRNPSGKIYDHKKIYAICADKYLVKDYIAKKTGKEYLVPLLLKTTNPEEINLSKLPKRFVVKANHGGGMTLFVWNKSKIDLNLIKKNCRKWSSTNFYNLARE